MCHTIERFGQLGGRFRGSRGSPTNLIRMVTRLTGLREGVIMSFRTGRTCLGVALALAFGSLGCTGSTASRRGSGGDGEGGDGEGGAGTAGRGGGGNNMG